MESGEVAGKEARKRWYRLVQWRRSDQSNFVAGSGAATFLSSALVLRVPTGILGSSGQTSRDSLSSSPTFAKRPNLAWLPARLR